MFLLQLLHCHNNNHAGGGSDNSNGSRKWGNGIHVEQFRRDTSTGASGLGLRLLLVSLTDGGGMEGRTFCGHTPFVEEFLSRCCCSFVVVAFVCLPQDIF